jgi:hypothetical protein
MIIRAASLGAVLIASAQGLIAQSPWQVTPMARAVGVFSHADPVPGGDSRSEFTISQPTLMLSASYRSRWTALATVNVESVTMPDGELTIGSWGEGFVDRRHPHTTIHELLVSGTDILGNGDGSGSLGLVVGKGFAAFGTDDPMTRPIHRYPVNHHLAQILERATVTAQYRWGPVAVEATLFNGDEPETPGQWPLLRSSDGTWRFGDSWSTRLQVTPVAGVELQGSVAKVHSGEHREGAGGDANKLSTSVRLQRVTSAGELYGLVEWARTSELEGFFVFHSFLAEGSLRRDRWELAYRFERTERPEEERTSNLFRTRRPHHENSLLGVSRWSLHTFRVSRELPGPSRTAFVPFLEVTLGQIAEVGNGIIDVASLYGGTNVLQLTGGFVLTLGNSRHRMGRYGIHAMPGDHEH